MCEQGQPSGRRGRAWMALLRWEGGRGAAGRKKQAAAGAESTHVSWRMGSSFSSHSRSPTNRLASSSRSTAAFLGTSDSVGSASNLSFAGEERSRVEILAAAALEGVSRVAELMVGRREKVGVWVGGGVEWRERRERGRDGGEEVGGGRAGWGCG